MRTSGCLWLRIAIPSGPVQVTWQLGDAGTTLDEIEARFRVIVFHGEVSRMLDEGQSRERAGGGAWSLTTWHRRSRMRVDSPASRVSPVGQVLCTPWRDKCSCLLLTATRKRGLRTTLRSLALVGKRNTHTKLVHRGYAAKRAPPSSFLHRHRRASPYCARWGFEESLYTRAII